MGLVSTTDATAAPGAPGRAGTLDGAGAGHAPLAAPSVLTKLFFGFTAVVETTKFQIYEIFLIFYYAQVLGLKGSLAGLAVAIAIIADAVLDEADVANLGADLDCAAPALDLEVSDHGDGISIGERGAMGITNQLRFRSGGCSLR